MNDKKVSYDSEKLVLVDENDNITGYLDKGSCHNNGGILHRAFSIFIFNGKNEVLFQRRSGDKRLWPLYWSNSCCSHPRKGETMEEATERRLQEELGFTAELEYLYKFQYQADFGDKGAENELCYVYIGYYDGDIKPNKNEIAETKFVPVEELENELQNNPDKYTPWSKMEWKRLITEFREKIDAVTGANKNK